LDTLSRVDGGEGGGEVVRPGNGQGRKKKKKRKKKCREDGEECCKQEKQKIEKEGEWRQEGKGKKLCHRPR